MFDREEAYAKAHKDMPASVFFGIGGRETLAAGKKRSRSEEDADMVADLREFDAALKSHRYPGLATRLTVFADEDHAERVPASADAWTAGVFETGTLNRKQKAR